MKDQCGILQNRGAWKGTERGMGFLSLESTKGWREAGRDSRRNRQELDRQAADKRWVEELCEQPSGKQVSQRPRAKQREQGTRRQILAPTVLGTDSSASHVPDKSCY